MARRARSASELLHQAISAFLRAHRVPVGRVVVGVSGGPDSSALLHALESLPHRSFDVGAVHLNHHLRGVESDADEAWVRQFCASLGVPLEVLDGALDDEGVRARGIEAAARQIRYERFRALRGGDDRTWIATAHHAGDQAETVLLRLATGRGPWRLNGILPVQDGVIRPLLHVERETIESYLREHAIEARRDSSNNSPRFLRNRVRSGLLPVLRAINPRVVRHLAETAELEQEREALLASVMRRWEALFERAPGSATARIAQLPEEPLLRRALIRAEIRRIDADERYVDMPALRRLEELLDAPGRLRPSRSVELVSDGELLVVRRLHAQRIEAYEYAVAPGQVIEIPSAGWRVAVGLALEGDERTTSSQIVALPPGLAGPIVVRNRRAGDRFRPLGMAVEKKLSHFFIDRKIPKETRDRLPLVLVGGRIAWIAGVEIADEFRIGAGETERLLLCATRLEDDR